MKVIIYLLLINGLIKPVSAQNIPGTQTACTTAAQGQSGNFIISYTIGEMTLVQTWQNNGLMITQGINQPFISIADSNSHCFSKYEVRVFPNPTPGSFSINIGFLKIGKITTQLLDASGKTLQIESFDYNTFSTRHYNIQQMANGQYYLYLMFTETTTGQQRKCIYTIQKIK